MQIFKSLGICLSLLLLSACASSGGGQRAGLQMVSTNEMPSPILADLQASERPYRVGPFDKLTIDVFGSEELSKKEVQVDASGRITFPLVGTVEVAGKTPGEVSVALQDLFRGRFIKNPQISVNLKEIVSQTVTIGGEVNKPGVYPIVGKMTLMTAIASAEGWTDISSRGAVAIFRTVGGQDYVAFYNVKGIEKGNYPDPEIYASDVVMVGDSQGRKIWKDFLATSPLLAPVIYLLNSNN
jgi:polysaccharide export outer membrane protein